MISQAIRAKRPCPPALGCRRTCWLVAMLWTTVVAFADEPSAGPPITVGAPTPTPIAVGAPTPTLAADASVATLASLSREVFAEDRDAFEAAVEAEIDLRLASALAPVATNPEERMDLEAIGVDVRSFLVRGKKNYDFPKMLVYNEFFKGPLCDVAPASLWAKLCRRPFEASNAPRPGDRLCHSSFFTNVCIASYTPDRLAAECATNRPAPPLKITKVKEGGTSEGIWVKDAYDRTYILVFDPPFAPEMTTSAEFIGSTLLRMAGYCVPKTVIATVCGTGDDRFDGRRVVATIALKNFKGGWRYAEFRDRREIRALQVFAGWINNVDQTEQNTGATISDAGACRHYVLDFGSSLGSFTFRPQPARLGWTKLFDPYEQFTQPLYDCGWRKVPWEAPYRVQSAAVGCFSSNYDPDRWQPFYRNLGFQHVTEADRRWAADRIAQFTDEQIHAVVGLAGYSHPSDADHVARTLIERRNVIVERYR